MTAMQRSFRNRGGLPWWWWRHHADRRARNEDGGDVLYGAGTPAGTLLGNETVGLAIDFTQNSALVRWPASPGSQYSGIPSALLTYTAPATKWVCDVSGNLVSGTTLRIDHDPVTHLPLGTLAEPARINAVLWCRDLTNAAWVKTNITAAKDQIGVDGAANSASAILATAANGTVLQTITIVSSARFESAYVKRITGSGTIQMTMDNGTTWTAVTVTANWTRVTIPGQTLANPVIGFRIVTSGDKIAVDFMQNEIGANATSPIATTTVAVTRAADQITLPVTAFPYNNVTQTLFAAGVYRLSAVSLMGLQVGDGTATNRIGAYLAYSIATQAGLLVNAGGSVQVAINTLGVIAVGSEVRVAAAVELNNFAAVSNSGSALVTDVAGTLPVVAATTLYMGCTQLATESLNGHIRRIKWLPRRVSNTELQGLVL